jgi:hypothetical protein
MSVPNEGVGAMGEGRGVKIQKRQRQIDQLSLCETARSYARQPFLLARLFGQETVPRCNEVDGVFR